MRSSPNPYCSCNRLMITTHPGGNWVCVHCDLPPAVEIVTNGSHRTGGTRNKSAGSDTP